MVTSRPEIVGTFGVVTTTHWLATTTGMTILERGGNAFDAAVAAGMVLHIVEPEENGPRRMLENLLVRLGDQLPRLSDSLSQHYLIHAGPSRQLGEIRTEPTP